MIKTLIVCALLLGCATNTCLASSVCAINEPQCTASCITVPGSANCGVDNCCDTDTSFKCSCQSYDTAGYCTRCGW